MVGVGVDLGRPRSGTWMHMLLVVACASSGGAVWVGLGQGVGGFQDWNLGCKQQSSAVFPSRWTASTLLFESSKDVQSGLVMWRYRSITDCSAV